MQASSGVNGVTAMAIIEVCVCLRLRERGDGAAKYFASPEIQHGTILLPHPGMAQHRPRNLAALQAVVQVPGLESVQVPGLRM